MDRLHAPARSGPADGVRWRLDALDGRGERSENRGVSSSDIDDYLSRLEEPKRSTLRQLRRTLLDVVPLAEEGISYGLPAFRVDGTVIAGFAAFKNHLSYLPHSGSVFPEMRDDLAGYETSSGALRFPVDTPLPGDLVEKLVTVRMAQAFPDRSGGTRPPPAVA